MLLGAATAFLMKVAVIGCGHWGRNLVRNFYELGVLAAVCDSNTKSLDHLDPNINRFSDYSLLLERDDINAIVIATPASTHYKLARAALLKDKHVYVEKPLAQNNSDAEELYRLACERGLILMVGHLLLYHPAVNKLKHLISAGELGDIQYLNSDRRNFTRSPKRDLNVMWDLAPHDFSMMSYLLSSEPEEILAVRGWSSGDDDIVDVVHIDLVFPNNIGAHIHNSWLDPQKQALLTVNGSKKTAVLNDTFKENKLELYSRNADGSITVEKPVYANDEPLRLECKHFLDCIEHKIVPTTDGIQGVQIVQYLSRSQELLEVGNQLQVQR